MYHISPKLRKRFTDHLTIYKNFISIKAQVIPVRLRGVIKRRLGQNGRIDKVGALQYQIIILLLIRGPLILSFISYEFEQFDK